MDARGVVGANKGVQAVAEPDIRPSPVVEPPDAQLLQLFLRERDEQAFARIVERHGPMVLGVCRRIVNNPHDAEDAFQATFLVLVRKARKVRPRELGQWLYGVAYRTAHKARVVATRRADHERRAGVMKVSSTDEQSQWSDLQAVLDDEIQRLPARYRGAVIACDLQCKSRQQAADDLGLNANTLSSRLSRGREILARRLSGRGVSLTAAALASLMAAHGASAAPAAPLVATTVSAASAVCAGGGLVGAGVISAKAVILSEGVLKAMFITKAKIAAAIVLGAAVVGSGAGVATQMALAQKAPKVAQEPPKGKSDKGNWIAPDISGRVMEVSADGSQLTIETGKGSKSKSPDGEIVKTAPTTTTVKVPGAAKVTFNAIGPDGDKPTVGYGASVWLETGSKDTAASVQYSGTENFKAGGKESPQIQGKLTGISVDGKRLTIETAPVKVSKEKGVPAPEAATTEVDLTEKTVLTFSGVSTDGAHPVEGMSVQIMQDEKNPKQAASARFFGTEAGVKGAPGDKQADLSGQVSEVDNGGKRLWIAGKPQAKNEAAPKTEVQLNDATKVTYMNVPLDGAKPMEGYVAQVWLDGKVATRVRFEVFKPEKGPDVSSRVVAVSPDGKTVSVEVPGETKQDPPQRKEISIANAKVVFNGVGPGEAKPTEGYEARIWMEADAPGTASRVMFTKQGTGPLKGL